MARCLPRVRPITITASSSAADTCASSLLEDNVRVAAGQPFHPAGVAAAKRTRIQLNQPDVGIASGGEPQLDPITVGPEKAVVDAEAVLALRSHFNAYPPERGIG